MFAPCRSIALVNHLRGVHGPSKPAPSLCPVFGPNCVIFVFGLCYMIFYCCVMCSFILCSVLRALRALRARCAGSPRSRVRYLASLGAGPSGPLRALRARCGRFAPAGLFAWLFVVARLPGWSWQPVCPATFLPGSNPVVSSGQEVSSSNRLLFGLILHPLTSVGV